MRRPAPVTIYTALPHKRPKEDTVLLLWLKAHGISKDKFAKMVGCTGKMIDLYCAGQVMPDLVFAIKIEQITKGAVGAEMWLGTSLGKYRWMEIEKRITVMPDGAKRET